MALSHLFQLPKPKAFLFCIPLRSAVELIVFILLINKVTGLYGILALFTGYELNFTQLSSYIYSLTTLALVAWLSTTIRKPEAALKTVGLAWLYVLDTLINTIYTSFFIASWFSVLAQHLGHEPNINIPGSGTIEDTAGFTSPEIDASHVDVETKPSGGIMPGQAATVVASTNGTQDSSLLESGGVASLVIIAIFILIRLYFCLIVLSYARSMLRQYVVMTSSSYAQSDDFTMAENPFRAGRDEGRGWRGKIGRLLMRFPSKHYWLGMDDADAWSKQTAGRMSERKTLRPRVASSDTLRVATKKLESQ